MPGPLVLHNTSEKAARMGVFSPFCLYSLLRFDGIWMAHVISASYATYTGLQAAAC